MLTAPARTPVTDFESALLQAWTAADEEAALGEEFGAGLIRRIELFKLLGVVCSEWVELFLNNALQEFSTFLAC